MPAGHIALAKYVTQIMDRNDLSTYEVARRSGKFKLANGTVWNVQNGKVKELKENTLLGLAKALGVPKDELIAVYQGTPRPAEPDELRIVECYRALPADKKNVAKLFIETLYREYGVDVESKKKIAR